MPFAGSAVNTKWAEANKATTQKIVAVYNQSIAWLYDPKIQPRSGADSEQGKQAEDRGRREGLRFSIGGKFFEPTSKVSRGTARQTGRGLAGAGDHAAASGIGLLPGSIGCSSPARLRRLRLTCWMRLRQKYLAGTLSVVGGLLLWEVGEPAFCRQPAVSGSALADRGRDLFADLTGEMQRHLAISAVEFAIGYVIASVIGIASASAWLTTPASSRRCSRGFPGFMRRRPLRSRPCSSFGSASASGRRCWW